MMEKCLLTKAFVFSFPVALSHLCAALQALLVDLSGAQNSITVPSEIVEALRFLKIFVRQISLLPLTVETLLSHLTG